MTQLSDGFLKYKFEKDTKVIALSLLEATAAAGDQLAVYPLSGSYGDW